MAGGFFVEINQFDIFPLRQRQIAEYVKAVVGII
jgi:hypothetical protein